MPEWTKIGMLLLLLCTCAQCTVKSVVPIQPKVKLENLHQSSSNHPEDFFTPRGIEIKFPVVDSVYHISWKRSATYDTLLLSLPLINGRHVSNPRLVDENRDYLYFENGCGSPCWNGFLLPLNGGLNALTVEYPIAIDLKGHRIATIRGNDQLAIYNLKTYEEQIIQTAKCSSAFVGFCLDTAYFAGASFIYKWGGDGKSYSGDELLIQKDVSWH